MIEKEITEKIIFDSPMALQQSVLYGVDTDGNTVVLGTDRDIYSLLKVDYSKQGLIGIAVHVTGWAAPLNPETDETDVPPSEHPERSRVVLVATLTVNGFCSGIKTARQVPGAVLEQTVFEEEAPSGGLWDAMNECFDKIKMVAK